MGQSRGHRGWAPKAGRPSPGPAWGPPHLTSGLGLQTLGDSVSAVLGTWGAVTSGGHLGDWSSWTSVQCELSGQRRDGQRPGLREDEVPGGEASEEPRAGPGEVEVWPLRLITGPTTGCTWVGRPEPPMATSIPMPLQAGCWAPGCLQTPHHTRRYPDCRLVLHISHLKNIGTQHSGLTGANCPPGKPPASCGGCSQAPLREKRYPPPPPGSLEGAAFHLSSS